MTAVKELADTTELMERTAKLNPRKRAEVEQDREGANAYAWGFQDGAKEPMDSAEAWNFMAAYWRYSLEWSEGVRPGKRNIPDSFTRWRETGEIV